MKRLIANTHFVKTSKVLFLGGLTILPFVYVYYFVHIILNPVYVEGVGYQVAISTPLHIAFMLLVIGLFWVYLRNITKREEFSKSQRMLWSVALCLGHMLVMPVYWCLYFWPLRNSTEAGKGGTQSPTTDGEPNAEPHGSREK